MKNTTELRAFLVKQMDGVAGGEVNKDQAKAISNLAQQVYNTLNIELKMAMAKEKLGDVAITAVEFGA